MDESSTYSPAVWAPRAKILQVAGRFVKDHRVALPQAGHVLAERLPDQVLQQRGIVRLLDGTDGQHGNGKKRQSKHGAYYTKRVICNRGRCP